MQSVLFVHEHQPFYLSRGKITRDVIPGDSAKHGINGWFSNQVISHADYILVRVTKELPYIYRFYKCRTAHHDLDALLKVPLFQQILEMCGSSEIKIRNLDHLPTINGKTPCIPELSVGSDADLVAIRMIVS